MKKTQAIALSDANEHLIYASMLGDPSEIRAAEEELVRAKNIPDGTSPAVVVDQLIKDDPIGSFLAGLLDLDMLEAIFKASPKSYLEAKDAASVDRDPKTLRDIINRLLVESDPVGAAAVGLLNFAELESIVMAAPSEYLEQDEIVAVKEQPWTLRFVVAARMAGVSFGELYAEPLIGRDDYALAARGSRQAAANLMDSLQELMGGNTDLD